MSKAAVRAIKFFERFADTGLRGKITASFFSGLLKMIHPRKKVIDDNLALAYPESPERWRKDIRGQIYENLAWTLTEVLALQRDHSQAFSWVKKVHNLKLVDDLVDSGRGAIFLTGHFGNWELLGSWTAQYLQKKGSALHVVYQELHDEDISRYVHETRERGKMLLLDKGVSVHKFAHMLKGGAFVAVLNDVAGVREVTVPFMGHDATNTPGPAIMAMLSGVPIVPACIYRNAPFEHEAEFFEPIKLPDNSIKHEDRMRAIVLECNRAYEMIIRKRPELWFWLHKRWRP